MAFGFDSVWKFIKNKATNPFYGVIPGSKQSTEYQLFGGNPLSLAGNPKQFDKSVLNTGEVYSKGLGQKPSFITPFTPFTDAGRSGDAVFFDDMGKRRGPWSF